MNMHEYKEHSVEGKRGGKEQNRRKKGYVYRPVSYVPKAQRRVDPEGPATEAEAIAKEVVQGAVLQVQFGKLTRDVLLSLYKDIPDATEKMYCFPEVFSDSSLAPEAHKEFKLPMSSAIMPPRKKGIIPRDRQYQPEEKYGSSHDFHTTNDYENDDGIIEPSGPLLSKITNAPLWYGESNAEELEKDTGHFEGSQGVKNDASQRLGIDEENALFSRKLERPPVDDVLKLFSPEDSYSNVDKKFEESILSSKIQKELFGGESAESKPVEYKNVIDASSLEAQMIKPKNEGQENDDPDESEEAPSWDTVPTEDIQNFTSKHQGDWGLTLNQDKDAMRREVFREEPEAPPVFFYNENKNPFCHSAWGIKESDKVWYYKDMQDSLHGPFSSIDMYIWHKNQFFPPNLLVSCSELLPFTPLNEFLMWSMPPTVHIPYSIAVPSEVPYYNALYEQEYPTLNEIKSHAPASKTHPPQPAISYKKSRGGKKSRKGQRMPIQRLAAYTGEDPAIASAQFSLGSRVVDTYPDPQPAEPNSHKLQELFGLAGPTQPTK